MGAGQFDWSEDWAMLGGRQTKLQVAHTKLSHSRAFAVRAYPLLTGDRGIKIFFGGNFPYISKVY